MVARIDLDHSLLAKDLHTAEKKPGKYIIYIGWPFAQLKFGDSINKRKMEELILKISYSLIPSKKYHDHVFACVKEVCVPAQKEIVCRELTFLVFITLNVLRWGRIWVEEVRSEISDFCVSVKALRKRNFHRLGKGLNLFSHR